jgi:predicted PurR-regulated permease PerM
MGDPRGGSVHQATGVNARPPAQDLARISLGVLFIGLMIVASLWVLQPFIGATVWATMVVVATWPMMRAVEARLGGRRWAAVAVMTAAMLLVLVLPLLAAVATIVGHADDIVGWSRAAVRAGVPSPPGWVATIPVVGSRAAREWQQLAATPPEELMAWATPYVRTGLQWFAGQAGGFGLMLLHFVLTVLIAAILYANGEAAAGVVRRFARRLAGERGESSAVLAGQAIRAVALGVVVTAIVQSAAAGIGLAVSGIPYAAVLTALIFMLCIAQAPAVGWLYWTSGPLWGTVLLVWTVLVGALDNVLRPLLIKRGADLPLLLIFAGVIGGLIGLGIIGLFVGPAVLAVTYRLLESWIADIDRHPGDSAGPA